MKKSNSRIVTLLTKLYPQVVWKAEKEGFSWSYHSELGIARWVSALAPQHPSDDSTCQSQLWLYYFKDKSPDHIINGSYYQA